MTLLSLVCSGVLRGAPYVCLGGLELTPYCQQTETLDVASPPVEII